MNTSYDLILVVSSSRKSLINMTKRCIDSALQDKANVNVIIVETYPVLYDYGYQSIQYKSNFNYNRALNLGISQSKSDNLILANNDLYFYPGWSDIASLMRANDCGSASVLSLDHLKRGYKIENSYYPGYRIGLELTGWLLFVTRETLSKIGRLDETFEFWHSDNVYADQLRKAGIRHGLFCNIRVDHLTSQTLRTIPYRKQRQYSFDSIQKYRQYAM